MRDRLSSPEREATSRLSNGAPTRPPGSPGAWCSAVRLAECVLQSAREILGPSHAPVVEEVHARRLASHVLMDGHDVDVGASQRLEHALELALEHGEVAVDDRLIVA